MLMEPIARYWHETDFSISMARRADVPYQCDAHYHDVYEIYYLISGTRRQLVDNRIYDIQKGDMILIPKNAVHKTSCIDRNPHVRYLLSFSDLFIQSICTEMGPDTIGNVFQTVKLTVPETRREYVRNLFDKISDESQSGNTDQYSAMLIKNYLAELFAFLIRYRRSDPTTDGQEEIREAKIQQATKYISDHYNQNITLRDVAESVYMSETYFSKKFKKVTGLNFSEYLTSIRLQQADKLLSETSLSIADVAERCGFCDANYFGDVFRKAKGISPLKYRKQKEKT